MKHKLVTDYIKEESNQIKERKEKAFAYTVLILNGLIIAYFVWGLAGSL